MSAEQCTHLRKGDNDEGFEVCFDCGFALGLCYSKPRSLRVPATEELLFKRDPYQTGSRGKEISASGSGKLLWANCFLYDVCMNNNVCMSTYHLATGILKTWTLLYSTEERRRKLGGKMHQIATFSLFMGFIKDEAARTPEEVCGMCDISQNQFWTIEKEYYAKKDEANSITGDIWRNQSSSRALAETDDSLIDWSDLCGRYASALGLSFSDIRRLLIELRDVMMRNMGGTRPQSIIAALLYEHTRAGTYSMLTLDQICRVCKVSRGNTLKVWRRHLRKPAI